MLLKSFLIFVVLMVLNCGLSEGQDNICDGMNFMDKIKNPKDCGSYYLCYIENVPLRIVCAGDHEFNERTGFCDIPEIAQCDLDQEQPSTIETSTLSTTTSNPSFPTCNESVVSWEPNPHSCSRYFLCFHGNPIERSCAPGNFSFGNNIYYKQQIIEFFF